MIDLTEAERETIEMTVKELGMIVEDYTNMEVRDKSGREYALLLISKNERETYQNLVKQLKEMLR